MVDPKVPALDPTLPAAAPPGALPAGTAVGRYVVVEQVGSGGIGVVYRAHDPELDRDVAIKLLQPHRAIPEARQFVLREAQALARLSHPNVVAVHDTGVHGEQIFIAMELLDGCTLRAWLAAAPRSTREIVDNLIAAGRGIAAAHRAGLIHRDLKPDNIVVCQDGSVRVLDFGLARLVRDRTSEPPSGGEGSVPALRSTLSQTGDLEGTPRYMAPEQLLKRPVDERADQFGFCSTLFEALYGHPPFRGRTLEEQILAVTSGTLQLPPTSRRIPARIRRALHVGLRVAPEQRHPSMDALLALLVRRSRGWMLGLAAGAAGAAAIAILAWPGAPPSRPAAALDCDEGARQLAEVWAPATRTTDLATSMVRGVDAWTARWTAAYATVCSSAQGPGKISPYLAELRMGCLDQGRIELRELLVVLAEDGHAKGGAAASAIARLTPPERCVGLRAPDVAPPDARDRPNVAAFEARAGRVRALLAGGSIDAAEAELRATLIGARTVGYQPLLARLTLLDAHVANMRGDPRRAGELAREAVRLAAASRDHATEAAAWIVLLQIVSADLARPEQTEPLLDAAQTAVVRAGGGDDLELQLNVARGRVHLRQGKPNLAFDDGRRALAIAERLYGPEHAETAAVVNLLAIVESERDNLAEAAALHRRALAIREATLGPEHPDVASSLGNLGDIELRQQAWAQAERDCREALAIESRTLPADHHDLAFNLTCVGEALLGQRRFAPAIEVLERAFSLRNSAGDPSERGRTYFALARALSSGRASGRALELARAARELYAQAGARSAAELSQVTRWLAGHDR